MDEVKKPKPKPKRKPAKTPKNKAMDGAPENKSIGRRQMTKDDDE